MTLDHSAISTELPGLRASSRAWTRFQLSEPPQVSIHYAGQHLPLAVCDESFGGVGILAPLDVAIPVNGTITVDYCGAPMRGTVRYVQPCGDQQRIGIEWGAFSADTGVTELHPANE